MLPVRVVLNRIYAYHVSNMTPEQRKQYDRDLYGMASTEAEDLAAVYEAAAAAEDEFADELFEED